MNLGKGQRLGKGGLSSVRQRLPRDPARRPSGLEVEPARDAIDI